MEQVPFRRSRRPDIPDARFPDHMTHCEPEKFHIINNTASSEKKSKKVR
jgi:hypothetical protein